MKPALALFALLLLIAAALAPGRDALAQGSGGFEQFYTWVEDSRERKVWLNPSLIAEFNPASSGGGPGAGVRLARGLSGGGPVIRFWRLDEATTPETGMTMMKSFNPGGRFSPVFHPDPSGGAKMALPGNVIVYLDPEWSPELVAAWASRHGLSVVSELKFGKNILLIASPPGLAALDEAARLWWLDGVVQALPNWWIERATR